METTTVGIREFRADLAGYIATSTPVIVTRHGQTVGYFLPAQTCSATDLLTLQQAGQAMDSLLADNHIDPEELVADFKAARRAASSGKKQLTKAA